MPSGSFMQVNCVCPFYRSDDGRNRIVCEGVIPDSQLTNYFKKKSDYRIQIEIFCCDRYENCEIYEAVNKKYKEGD